MNVTVEVVGGGAAQYDLADDAPVPGDRVVDADEVRLLRLIKGGATDGGA